MLGVLILVTARAALLRERRGGRREQLRDPQNSAELFEL